MNSRPEIVGVVKSYLQIPTSDKVILGSRCGQSWRAVAGHYPGGVAAHSSIQPQQAGVSLYSAFLESQRNWQRATENLSSKKRKTSKVEPWIWICHNAAKKKKLWINIPMSKSFKSSVYLRLPLPPSLSLSLSLTHTHTHFPYWSANTGTSDRERHWWVCFYFSCTIQHVFVLLRWFVRWKVSGHTAAVVKSSLQNTDTATADKKYGEIRFSYDWQPVTSCPRLCYAYVNIAFSKMTYGCRGMGTGHLISEACLFSDKTSRDISFVLYIFLLISTSFDLGSSLEKNFKGKIIFYKVLQ